MAKYDQGGGCGCGLHKTCCCDLNMNNNPFYKEDFEPKEISAIKIHNYSDQREVSLTQAKKTLTNNKLKESLHRVREHGTIEDKVNWLMNRFIESL